MRLLTISNCPLREELGSAYVALNYARRLRDLGHTVELYGPSDYEPFSGLRRAIRYRQSIGMALLSLRKLRRGRFDLVEFYGAESWLAITLLARRGSRDFLVVSHSNGIETHAMEAMAAATEPEKHPPRRRGFGYRLAERAFRGSDGIVTVSRYDLEHAAGRGYAAPHRLLALDNPLPPSFLGRQVGSQRRHIIGYVGTWIPRKGTALMRADVPRLLREFPDWSLRLVGVGESFRAGEHFPADILDRVEVVPFADRLHELPALYEETAIAILPSRYESFGLTAAEAMACGCALVATPVGFAHGLRNGEEAILHGHASPSLYEALRSAVQDPNLRRSVALRGYERVQELRWENAARRLEETYLRWLAQLRGLQAMEGEPP